MEQSKLSSKDLASANKKYDLIAENDESLSKLGASVIGDNELNQEELLFLGDGGASPDKEEAKSVIMMKNA